MNMTRNSWQHGSNLKPVVSVSVGDRHSTHTAGLDGRDPEG